MLDSEVQLAERSLLAPDYVPVLAARLGLRGEDALELVSAPRDWFRSQFSERPQMPVRAAWHRTPFEVRPFLRLQDERLLLTSPRAMQSWLSDGFYHRLLACARRRRCVPQFQRFFGFLVERYVAMVVAEAHSGPRPAGSGRVSLDRRYGRRGSKRSPDLAVDCGPDLVLVEVTSGRFTLRTLLDGSAEAALRDLQRLLFEKVDQLGGRIADFLAGEWSPHDVTPALIRRIWPVVVTADVLQNELLWDEIDRRSPPVFMDPRVQALTLLDLTDVEQLAALIERGSSLVGLLERKATGPYRRLDFRRFAFDEPDLDHQAHFTPIVARWTETMVRAAGALGFEADEAKARRAAGVE